MLYSIAINAILCCIRILAVITVFIVVTAKYEVAVFIFECVICVLAVFRLRKLERDARLLQLESAEIFYERHGLIIPEAYAAFLNAFAALSTLTT